MLFLNDLPVEDFFTHQRGPVHCPPLAQGRMLPRMEENKQWQSIKHFAFVKPNGRNKVSWLDWRNGLFYGWLPGLLPGSTLTTSRYLAWSLWRVQAQATGGQAPIVWDWLLLSSV